MTAIKVQEHLLPGAAFARAPVVGDYYRTKTGGSVLHIQRVSRMIHAKGGDTYRLQAVRVKLCQMPDGIEPLPWPMPRTRRRSDPPERQARPVTTRAMREKAERDRVRALKAGGDPNHLVQQVRLDNKSATQREWRDPDDLSPNRRTARVVSGYAGRDEIQVLLDAGTLTPSLGRTARRFLKEYELGNLGLSGGRNLLQEPSGFASGQGPSETRLLHVEVYRATAQAIRPYFLRLLITVIGRNTTIEDYAGRYQIERREVTGALVGALFFLRDYYKELDDKPLDEARLA